MVMDFLFFLRTSSIFLHPDCGSWSFLARRFLFLFTTRGQRGVLKGGGFNFLFHYPWTLQIIFYWIMAFSCGSETLAILAFECGFKMRATPAFLYEEETSRAMALLKGSNHEILLC